MPRKPRLHYNGAFFHVICRGNNRDWVLKSDAEKQRYLELVKHYKALYSFKLYAWAILSNHVHMLIEVKDVPLSKIMQGIQQSYTQWYNRAYDHKGHVFEQRYKAIHCNKDVYLLNLLRYIHQNPVRLGLEGGLQYPWSSHNDYIGKHKTGMTDTDFALALFAEKKERAVAGYCEFMDIEEKDLGQMLEYQLEVGLEAKETVLPEKVLAGVDFEWILETASTLVGVEVEEILGKSKRREVSKCRKLIMVFSLNHTEYSQKKISERLYMSESALPKALKSGLDVSVELEEMIKLAKFQA